DDKGCVFNRHRCNPTVIVFFPTVIVCFPIVIASSGTAFECPPRPSLRGTKQSIRTTSQGRKIASYLARTEGVRCDDGSRKIASYLARTEGVRCDDGSRKIASYLART